MLFTLIFSDQNNMANTAKRALANITVLDYLSFSSASPVLPASANSLCAVQLETKRSMETSLCWMTCSSTGEPWNPNRPCVGWPAAAHPGIQIHLVLDDLQQPTLESKSSLCWMTWSGQPWNPNQSCVGWPEVANPGILTDLVSDDLQQPTLES